MGEFIATELANAICSGFHERPKEICRRDYIKDHLVNRKAWNIAEYGDGISTDILFYATIIVIINIAVLGYCKYKKAEKGLIQSEVD
jgi:hypothetical protein